MNKYPSTPSRVFSALTKSFLVVGALAISAAGFIACNDVASTKDAASSDSASSNVKPLSKDLKDPALIKRGEYLVTAMGCDDCHSPKKMGPRGPELVAELRFGGFPANTQLPKVDPKVLKSGWALFSPDLTSAVGPWGQTYAANISSDSTGIGNWKEEQFFKALREGKLKGLEGTRPILPPMPWQNYSKMEEEDLRAIFAYLKSSLPVKNLVPAPKPPQSLN